MDALAEFKRRVLDHLLPEFCNDPTRGWGISGFRPDWTSISECDAADFLRALDGGVLTPVGRGQYVCPRSAAKEQFFWSGSKAIEPRPVYLWREPVITAAGLARLHFDYGWPITSLGAQSSDWAFDFFATRPEEPSRFEIVCEVKKTEREIEDLVAWMRNLHAEGVLSEEGLCSGQRNAVRKLISLHVHRPRLFWALGPGRSGHMLEVSLVDATLFRAVSEASLHFSA